MKRVLIATILVSLVSLPAFAQGDLRLITPPRIFTVPGVETNVYFDNVLLHPSSDALLYDVDCSLGAQQHERWTATPSDGDVGEHTLTLRVVSPEMAAIEEQSVIVEVVDPAAGTGRKITLLCIGDSLTAASAITGRLVGLFEADQSVDATMIGEAGPDAGTGNRHEGYGGWTCERFATAWDSEDYREIGGRMRRARSPFVFEAEGQQPALDFQRYLDANNGGEPPDFITILLGCNDTFSATEETIEERIDAMSGHLEALIVAIREAAPDTEIALLTLVPPAASQDAFAASYRNGQTRWQYRRNQHRVVERQYQTWAGREDDGIFVVPTHANLDTVHGFPRVSVPANAHAAEEISRMSNGVHPATAGYYQIGDSIYCWLKSRLAD
ncbi:MAG: SGNH/GDSL hydrolase family protein [Armatimonadota bacterium]